MFTVHAKVEGCHKAFVFQGFSSIYFQALKFETVLKKKKNLFLIYASDRRIIDVYKEVHIMAKEKLNLSLDEDIKEKLAQYAEEQHTTISQAVTDWILTLKVRNPQVRGQMHF